MKKIGIIVFIIAILVGVVFANLVSFGKSAGNIFSFSFGSRVKGSGVTATDARNATGFTGVDVGGVFQVEITAGKDYAVEVEADDNLLQYIKTEVDGDVLRVTTTERLKSHNAILVRVSAPDIDHVDASGASKVSLTGVNNSELTLDTSGASKVSLTGETGALKINVSGASKIDADTLKAENANVDASGASKVSVFVTGRLTSEASGASKIGYKGNPTSVDKNSSGASTIYQQ